MSDHLASVYPEYAAGGFTRYDGGIEFYGRLNALLKPDMIAVDLGAGRGQQFDTDNAYKLDVLNIQGKVAKVIGIDVDDAVMQNAHLDEALTYDGRELPLDDKSVDLIYCDWVLEHVENPNIFAAEVDRVLRPNGWFCARTPNSFSILAVASRLIPNNVHARFLQKIQPGNREARDVFPTFYRMNSQRTIRRIFPDDKWLNCSYTWSAEPGYAFGKAALVRLIGALQYLKKPFGGEALYVFLQKKG